MARTDFLPCSLSVAIAALLGTLLICTALEIKAEESSALGIGDAAIQAALKAISLRRLPESDARLIYLINENLKEIFTGAKNPTNGIEAVAKRAQKTVSEVTAAYAAAIFQSNSVEEAQRLFERFQRTVERIVDLARGGNFGVHVESTGLKKIKSLDKGE
ncbi:uncharacterized protein LOC110117269 [Athalia rosae]|uniref:uncharacterized protein LOC110117269 n=1 Tax=Athalia rosae TaxID=37344 RepID=UPI002033AFA4|nr:uncharacterized protein LOC110117269 [Athalia rosae]